MEDLGWTVEAEIRVGSSAARGMASRQGLGRTCHVDVRHLRLQTAVGRGVLRIGRIEGVVNPDDVPTKIINHSDAMSLLKAVNFLRGRRFGRHRTWSRWARAEGVADLVWVVTFASPFGSSVVCVSDINSPLIF